MTEIEGVDTPQIERVVDFYGDQVPVAQVEEGKLYVPIHALTDNLGLSFSGQSDRIRRDNVLAAKSRQVAVTGADGKNRQQLCLPLDMIPGWLFGIAANRVKPELRERLDLYRAECFDVLWNAFKGDIMPAAPTPSGLTPAEQMLAQAEAIYQLARQQVDLERQYRMMAEYTRGFIRETRPQLTDHAQQLSGHEQRLVSLELRLDPISNVTEEQANEIALAVKNVAYALGGSSQSYGKVYSELYRRYRVTSYKSLPRSRYDEAMAWLGQWYVDIEGGQSK
ncbi:MAG: hypothetical protein DLM69_01960 [Candidatus Chloroheliales bacterium]|nr:MAG: hypothetical protein DLM69_01960 [Chloroflexota bacterium]